VNPNTLAIALKTDALAGVLFGDASVPLSCDCDVMSGVLSSSNSVESMEV